MHERQHIIDCYDKTAKTYADKFMDELSHKHLDRILLNSFVTENIHSSRWIDLGCGPGQTTKYVADLGVKDLKALQEIKSIDPGWSITFSFHTGDQVVHLDQFLEQEVNIDFYFFDTINVMDLLQKNGFEIIDALERQPYKEVEYQSKRAYIWVKRV
jgi:SAM-dependent methyltransferase